MLSEGVCSEQLGKLQEHLTPVLGDPGSSEIRLHRIGRGKANLTFELGWGDGRYALRRPPDGELPESAHDMLREARVMSAIQGTQVPVPRIVHVCDDRSVWGQPFYLMEFVDGTVLRDELPPDFHVASRWTLGTRVAEALADIHRIDVGEVGLEGLGKGAGYLQRQIERWHKQWATVATRSIPGVEKVGAWLREHQPAEQDICLVHGDFKLDNVVVGHGSPPSIAAVLDWEMSTLGDPLSDLGYLLLFWPEPGETTIRVSGQPSQEPGFPRRRQMLAAYEHRVGRRVDNLDFYVLLALWKVVIMFEGLYRLHIEDRLGESKEGQYYAAMEQRVPDLASRAEDLCRRIEAGEEATTLASI